MALHQAVRTTGKSTESRPPTPSLRAQGALVGPREKARPRGLGAPVESQGPGLPKGGGRSSRLRHTYAAAGVNFCQDTGGNWRILVKYEPMVSQMA
jgi:hypothetical protein